MWKVTWRNLLARKVRLLLSAFAIVLGVAFVAGSMIFTDAMGGAFDDIIEGSTSRRRGGLRGRQRLRLPAGQPHHPGAGGRASSRSCPEAESVHPQGILQTVFVIGEDGKVIGGNGPPGLAFNYTGAESLTGKPILELIEGDLPDGPDEIALDVDTVEKGGFDLGDEVTLATPGTPADHEGEADRARRVRLRRPQRRHPHDLRPRVPAGAVLRRQGRLHLDLAQRRRRRLASSELADAAQKVLPDGRRGADRRRLRRREQGVPRRDPRLPRDLPAGLRRGLAGGRHLPDHQHLLDPGRPAQPRARAAAGPGRLPPADQPVGGHRGARGRASSARRSGSASATCSRSGCAGCSASSASTSAGPSSRSPGRRWPGRTASGWW